MIAAIAASVIRNLVFNPVVIGLFLGILWRFTGVAITGPVGTVVDRLGDVAAKYSCIAGVEMHNEPNLRFFWGGTPKDYAEVCQVGGKIIDAFFLGSNLLACLFVIEEAGLRNAGHAAQQQRAAQAAG